MGVELLLVKEFFKKVSEQITTSIKFLINPSSWRKGYEQGKEYFPHLKTLVMDDIDIQKIVDFVAKNRKEHQVYKIIMQSANKDSFFMLWLPASRGEEVTNEVIDGKQSAVWLEALNRIHVQKSIIEWCLKN